MKLPCDFREILKSELALRFRKNPRYSLRAFARDLEMSAARLSEILNHSKGLSREAAIGVAKKIGLNLEEQIYFVDLVEAQHARSLKDREAAARRLKEHTARSRNLSLDSFRLVEDWHHFAILEQLKIEKSAQDYKILAETFEISEHEAKNACERMLRLELIELKNGRLIPVEDWVMVGGTIPSQSVKKHHEQIITRAIKTLYDRSTEERTFRSSIFACDPKKMGEIEAKILKFSKSIIKQYASENPNAEIMALGIQAFPLSKKTKD